MAHELYNTLYESVRIADQTLGMKFLERLFSRSEFWIQDTRRITHEELAKIDSPITCQPELIEHFVTQVGMTKRLAQTLMKGRSTTSQRRAVLSMIPLLRQRGTPRGKVGSFFTFSGREVIYSTWFDLIAVLGGSMVGYDFNMIGGADSVLDEYFSDLKMMDDGTIDEEQIVELGKLHRPSNEILRVTLLDFLDNFPSDDNEVSRSRWQNNADGYASFDGKVMTMPQIVIEDPIIPIKPWTAFDNTQLTFSFKFEEAGQRLVVFCCRDGDSEPGSRETEGAIINIFCDPDGSGGTTIGMVMTGGGTHLLNTSAAPFPLVPGAWYGATVYVQTELSGDLTIDLRINHQPFFKRGDPTPTHRYGKFAFQTPAQSGSVQIDNVLFTRLPVRLATIDKDGVSASSNFYA